jgi:SRSO17 transposase
VDVWAERVSEEDWTRIEVRDGEKGPLVVEAVKRCVRARTETGGEGPDELLFITRELQADHTYKLDYHLSCAEAATPLRELARVAKAEHRIEECLERAKGEAGLADYQVRNWPGWHRHQTLALLAAWFLTEETRRGKNPDPGLDVAAAQAADRGSHRGLAGRQRTEQAVPPQHPLAAPQRAGAVLLPSFT